MTIIIRLIITALILWGVYRETGKWTLLFGILITLNAKLQAYLNRERRKRETA